MLRGSLLPKRSPHFRQIGSDSTLILTRHQPHCRQLLLLELSIDHIVVTAFRTGGSRCAFGSVSFAGVHVLSQSLRGLQQFITRGLDCTSIVALCRFLHLFAIVSGDCGCNTPPARSATSPGKHRGSCRPASGLHPKLHPARLPESTRAW